MTTSDVGKRRGGAGMPATPPVEFISPILPFDWCKSVTTRDWGHELEEHTCQLESLAVYDLSLIRKKTPEG